jgi:hypothetical protein
VRGGPAKETGKQEHERRGKENTHDVVQVIPHGALGEIDKGQRLVEIEKVFRDFEKPLAV